jgi:hypothetical protein
LVRRPAARERSRLFARHPSFIGTITPSSDTATVTASSGTTDTSRNVDSNGSRFASQRALSALGKRSRELFDGAMLPSSRSSVSPSFGVICATTQLA